MEEGKFIVASMSSEHEYDVAEIHQLCFKRQMESLKWIRANRSGYPMILCSVALLDDKVIGFIIWEQKSGIRKQIVLELKQMAIRPDFQGRGFGKKMIDHSFRRSEYYLKDSKRKIKGIMVTTRADNVRAQNSYARVLGAKVVATIKNLFSSDEVIMVAKRKEIPLPMHPPWKD